MRPSYVLGGQGMEIARSDADIIEFMKIITSHMEIKEHPILVDKYVEGQECEVDAVCDGETSSCPVSCGIWSARVCTPATRFRCILRRPCRMRSA